jgi:hypothetical protein
MTARGFDLLRYGTAIGRIMSEWHAYTREVLRQGSDLGFVRELFVHHVLENIMPKSVVIGSGEIVDGEGNRSAQQDVIVYRADFPVITSLTPVNTYLIEGVIATVEVKSDLSAGTPNHLVAAFRNAGSVLALQKAANIITGTPEQVALLQRVSGVRAYVIGYAGWESVEPLLKRFTEGFFEAAWRPPHVVCQPGMCLTLDDGFLDPGHEAKPGGVLINRDHPHAVFLHHLLKAVMLNTSGTLVTAPGIDAVMNYYLDRYFNFNPPLAFERYTIRPATIP